MTIKRVILIILTAIAIALLGLNLISSFTQPQFQSQLELYQTNLILRVTELSSADPNFVSAQKSLIGAKPFENATKQYQEARQQLEQDLKRSQTMLEVPSAQELELKQAEAKLVRSLVQVDLNLGILQAHQGLVQQAQQTWKSAIERSPLQPSSSPSIAPARDTALILSGLWSDPPQLLPDAEQGVKQTLKGWFRYRALAQLYQLQQRQAAIQDLQTQEHPAAEKAFITLALIGGLPALAGIIGVGLWVFLGIQWALRGKQALLSPNTMPNWAVPWNWETIWEALIFGFFLIGQIVLPFLVTPLISGIVQAVGNSLAIAPERIAAFLILLNYCLLAVGGLGVVYLCIQSFLPLPDGWFRIPFRSRWWAWGLGGYFAALPLVILVSLINQQIWQGRGGSNPILPIALEGKDNLALVLFFVTAAIAAPIFEEILFRGFLLPSLTRYMSVWGAIALSSLIFAVAHLSLSEVLPLTTLGMVLGFVYTRSRNLLSSMLLHSLWNTGTLLSLFILGNSAS